MANVSSDDQKVNKNGKVVKKQIRKLEECNRQKQKRQRIAGREYVNANGEVVPPKQPGPDCNCRRKCFQKVPEDVRLKIFQGFYSMKTHDEQNVYLLSLMRQANIKRKRVKSSSRRSCTFEYFVRVKGRETQVCQTAFRNIHAIKERKVRVLCNKIDNGVMFPGDNRGKNTYWRSDDVYLPINIIDQIKNHIYSIVHTHRLKDFIRQDKFSGLEINISKMWKDYIKTYDPDNISATMPKSKRHVDQELPNEQNQQTHHPQPQDSFTPVEYPGSGHLINIVEKYFENQSQAALATSTNSTNPMQNGPLGVGIHTQSIVTRATQPPALVLLQTKPEPEEDNELPFQETQIHNSNEKHCEKLEYEETKIPLVKQKRYANIFHDEINSAALAAIKTRLGSYYDENIAARKKAKQARQQETDSRLNNN